MKRISAVTFDLWDTLIQERPGGSEKVARIRVARIGSVLSSVGLAFDSEEIMSAHERTGHFLRLVWSKNRDLPVGDQVLFMLNSLDVKLTGRLRADDLERLETAYSDCILENPPALLPGAKDALEWVRESDYRMGLISNTGRTPGSTLRVLMERLDILGFFEVTTFSNEIQVRKPAEGAFASTLLRLKAKPKAAVHVGDDPESDIAGAKQAGMRAIQVVPEGRQPSSHADLAVPSMEAVSAAMKRL